MNDERYCVVKSWIRKEGNCTAQRHEMLTQPDCEQFDQGRTEIIETGTDDGWIWAIARIYYTPNG